jgi:hypothetical protein
MAVCLFVWYKLLLTPCKCQSQDRSESRNQLAIMVLWKNLFRWLLWTTLVAQKTPPLDRTTRLKFLKWIQSRPTVNWDQATSKFTQTFSKIQRKLPFAKRKKKEKRQSLISICCVDVSLS